LGPRTNLAVSLRDLLMCTDTLNLRVSCFLLLSITCLNIISLCLCLFQQSTHVITVLNSRFVMLCWRWAIWSNRLIYYRSIYTKDIWWFLRVHSGISIFLLLNIRPSRSGAFSLHMLNDWLLLFIWLLLLILNNTWLVGVEALTLRRLTRFVSTAYAVLSVQLCIDSFTSISARGVSDNLWLLSKHLYLLIFLLSLSALRSTVISIRCIILGDINFVIYNWLIYSLRRSGFVHRLLSVGTLSNLRVWRLFAIYFIIHGLH